MHGNFRALPKGLLRRVTDLEQSELSFILGFDPGGKDHFAWSVCAVEGSQLLYCQSGVADNAQEVMQDLQLPASAQVVAAGIDAPMVWSYRGNRFVDNIIGKELKGKTLPKGRGLPTKGGRVLAVNSLRGGALVQGLLLGKYLRETYPALAITEAHPTALLRLLNVPCFQSQLNLLCNLIADIANEHERDATIAAFAAWSMCQPADGWNDLYPQEPCQVMPFGTSGSYWMPIKTGP